MKQQLLNKLVSCSQLQHRLQPHQFADFCQQLKKSGEVLDATNAQALLNLFCYFYWQLDELQKSSFENVCDVWIHASREAWMKIIPQLMEKSMVCNDLVFLAQMLMEELTSKERETLDEMYPFDWADDDDFSLITKAEYAYRKEKGLECWIRAQPMKKGKATKYYYCRPSCIDDFKYIKAMLDVLWLSGQKTYFCMKGLAD